MVIRRTANAGVLLTLDGVSILMDGVCREEYPYPATPPEERAALCEDWQDVVAFTHTHSDHYDPDFAASYQEHAGGVILGPEDVLFCRTTVQPVTVGSVTVTPIPSRHIGAAGKTTKHVSFLIQGSKRILFTGDSSPLFWKGREELPAVDMVIGPYAYAATPSALEIVKDLGAGDLIVLHLPERRIDPYGLWDAVENTIKQEHHVRVHIPAMSESLNL